MKKLVLLASLLIGFVACKEKDLSTDNPDLPDENLVIKTSFLYDTIGFNKDSMLMNDVGNQFYITEVKFLMSKLHFIHTNTPDRDSTVLDSGYYSIGTESVDKYVAILQPGGYAGNYGFQIGLDSLDFVTLSSQARGDAITDNDLRRNDFGYNSLYIKGRAIDPKDPLDTVGNIPFEYQIGGYFMSRKFKSDKINFAVSSSTKATFILNVDLEPIFNDFDIVATPEITSDISDPVDYQQAQMMMDSLEVKLF